MALGSTNISITAVKNEIGEGVTTVGGLITSENVNPWGFNLPLEVDQDKYFGNLLRTAPYELGAFRNYDHTWRCYSIGEPTISPLLANYESGNIVVNLKFFPYSSYSTSGVQHVFDVFFSRSNDFTHATHIQLYNDTIINDNGTLFIPINPFSPPDGGAALTPNSSVYFKIRHVSSPDRRWDKRRFITVPNIISKDIEDDAYIIKVDVGQDIFTYYTNFYKTEGTSPVVHKSAYGGMWAYVTLRNGNKTSVSVNMSFQINDNSSFTGARNATAYGTFTVPAATRSGSTLVLGTTDAVIYQSGSFSQWTIGQTYYGRVKINTCSSGTFSSGYQNTFNGTISNTPPLD